LVALSALSAFSNTEALQVVAGAVHDEDEGVRLAAIGFLARWPDTQATRILIEAMRSEPTRAQFAQALATPAPGRVEGLLAALETADDELAPALTAALGRVDSVEPSPAMLTALQSPNTASRKAAAAMLAAKGSREGLAALARHSTEDPSEEVRRVCMLLLAQ
jgi:HEAT repeat protein